MSPANPDRFVAQAKIEVEGRPLAPELLEQVREVKVASYLRLPDVCSIVVSLNAGTPEGAGEAMDKQPFKVGAKLEVKLGARDATTTATLFKGDVLTLEPHFGAGGLELVVRAFDPLHKLQRSRNVRTFQGQTTSDIVKKVLSDNSLSVDCDATDVTHEFIQQNNETDWDFVWRLADRIGFELVTDNGKVKFRKPTADASVTLTWPDDVHSFRPRVTAIQQATRVTVGGFDPKEKQSISVSASNPKTLAKIGVGRSEVMKDFAAAKVHVATEPVMDAKEGTALAQALLDKLANGYVAAEGVATGNPAIRAGANVEVKGLGQKFSGTYRVASATHVLRGGGIYETHFANSAAHTLLGSVGADRSGGRPDVAAQLCVGIVTNNSDPSGLGRVRVKYPALGTSADGQDVEGWWAPVLVPSAGDSRGMMMLPQANDEVLIGFEHDDVTRPYVLGSVFNGRAKPGSDLMQGQDGSMAVLSDKKILLQSKGDQIVKSQGKLTVEIDDNVEEKYKQDWKSEITGQATLKATQPFEIDGQNVTIKGQAQISVEGNAQVTIKCGAASIQLSPAGVQISGPMIQLG